MLTIRVEQALHLILLPTRHTQKRLRNTHSHYESMPSTQSGGVMASFKKRLLHHAKKPTHVVLSRNRRAGAAESYTEPANRSPVTPDGFTGGRSIAKVSTSGDKVEDQFLTCAPLQTSNHMVEKPSLLPAKEEYFATASPTPSLRLEPKDCGALLMTFDSRNRYRPPSQSRESSSG